MGGVWVILSLRLQQAALVRPHMRSVASYYSPSRATTSQRHSCFRKGAGFFTDHS